MPFPYLGEVTFEDGTAGTGNALTDTQSKSLGYLHYTESVARYGVVPYSGAYVWGLNQATGTKTTECRNTIAALNVANTEHWAAGCAIYLKGIVMGNGDRTTVLQAWGATGQGTLQLYYTTAGGLQLLGSLAHDTAVGTNPVTTITQNEWHWIEIRGDVQTGGTGTLDFFLDGAQFGAQVDTLTNVAITDLYFGAINADATCTAGLIFFDDVICTSHATVQPSVPMIERFRWNPVVTSYTQGQHVFVGPGTVASLSLLSGVTTDYIRMYDTDVHYTATGESFVGEVHSTLGVTEVATTYGPFAFERGCYVVLSSATARGQVHIDRGQATGYPMWIAHNDAGMKSYAQKRTATRFNR